MQNYKAILKTGGLKILSGFLLGLGFSLSFLAIYFYTTNLFQEKMMAEFKAGEENISSVEIISHEDKKMIDRLIVIGSLKNKSTETIRSITLETEFFENDIFVDECSEYIGWNILPGEIENFKVSCGRCSDSYQAPSYDKYTLKIRSVSFLRP